jgi:hypothetical protein
MIFKIKYMPLYFFQKYYLWSANNQKNIMKKNVILVSFLFASALLAFAGTDPKESGTDPKVSLGIKKSAARPDIPGTLQVDFGFSFLPNTPENMDIRAFGSRTLNVYYKKDYPFLNKFLFSPGIGFGMDRYKFSDNYTLTSVINDQGNREVEVTALNTFLGGSVSEIKKSMFITNYVDIPLEVSFLTNPSDPKASFRITAGGKVGMLLNSQTKVRYVEDDQNVTLKNRNDFEVSRFRYGVYGSVGTRGFSAFFYSSLNNLFNNGKGPGGTEASNFTVGLSVALF